MTPLKVINRPLLFVAILAATPLLFPTNVYAQECSRWEGFKRITFPCPTRKPKKGEEDVYVPGPEEVRRNEAREQNDLGVKAQNARNWALAAQHFEQAVAKDPDSTSYRDNLSNARKWIEFEARKAREEEERRKREALSAERKKLEAGRDKGGIKPIGGSDLFELKPANPGSSDLLPLDNRIERKFGKDPVWSQLNCAVDLMGQALSKVNPEDGAEPSFAESRNLLGEALNALNGDTTGVPCSMGGPLPRTSGRAPDLSRAVKKERELIERAIIAVDELEKVSRPDSDEERIAKAYQQQKENEREIAQRESDALKQPRKRSADKVVVPSPAQPPKSEAKLKIAVQKLQQEAQALLVSFPVIQRRRSLPPPRPK